MENETIHEETKPADTKPVRLKKKKRWPIILLAVLLLLAGGTYYAYTSDWLDPYIDSYGLPIPKHHQEEVIENEEETETEPQQNTADPLSSLPETTEPDPAFMNGTWISDEINGGTFELRIEAPDVYNTNGVKGKIEISEDPEHDYQIIFGEDSNAQGEIVKLYVDFLEEGSAVVWLPNEDGTYTLSVPISLQQASSLIDNNDSSSGSNSSASSGSSNSATSSSSGSAAGSNTSSEKTGHYEDQLVCVSQAYDEQVLVKKGACTDVLVQAAYDTEEMVYLDGAYYGPDTEEVRWCYICEHVYDDHCQLEGHPSTFKTVNLTDPYWHNVEYRTVHHDAVYETRCEPDEYKTVHHDAVYETRRVWVED